MTDIVERLRASVTKGHEPTDADAIEAADEIEWLRHEKMRLQTALDYHVNELRRARREINQLRGAA